MKHFKFAALIAALAVAHAGVAAAEENPGFYAGVGVGQSKVKVDDFGLSDHDTGFKVFGGYQFNRYLAAEAAYLDGGTAAQFVPDLNDDGSLSGTLDANGNQTGETDKVQSNAFNLSVLGTFPFNDYFGVMARAGLSFIDTGIDVTLNDVNQTNANFTRFGFDDRTQEFAYGAGLWAAPTKNILLRLEYEMTKASFSFDSVDLDGDGIVDPIPNVDVKSKLISLNFVYKFARQ